MSFFVRENFNLNNGAFQTGIVTDTSGNGTVYQDGGYGYVRTFADPDAALIVTEEGLPARDFFGVPIKFSIKYQLNFLEDGDRIRILTLTTKGEQPSACDIGIKRLSVEIRRSGDNYYEIWGYVDSEGTSYYYKYSTTTWTSNATDFVRTITPDSWYILTFTIHPGTQKVELSTEEVSSGSVRTAQTNNKIYRDEDDWWWYLGDVFTNNHFGRLKLGYIYVEDIKNRCRWTGLNSFTEEGRIKNGFDGSYITVVNDLTIRYKESFTVKNDILSFEPLRGGFLFLNNIGEKETTSISCSHRIFLDGEDISDAADKWEVSYDEDWFTRRVSITLRENSILRERSPYFFGDEGFYDPRIEVFVEEESIGQFYCENSEEEIKSGDYQGDINGRSKTALLDRPFSELITKSFSENISKRELVEGLTLTVPVQWNITDTIITANTYSARESSPIQIIREIAESGGGRLYSDSDDNLIVDYKDYETKGKSPVLSLCASNVIQTGYELNIPTGENSVGVEGYDDEKAYGRWPVVQLFASKSSLKSDGHDSLILTAWCYNPNGELNDVEEIIDEKRIPSDPHTISTEKTIKRVIGVWEDDMGSHGDLIEDPYEVEGSTIETKGEMANVLHLVSYVGGDTCSFSVDHLADVEESAVLIEGGLARTTLRASSGGGGYITVTATFRGQTDLLVITLADPKIASIEGWADPTKIARGQTSTITCRVTNPDGDPVEDGTPVYFSLIEGRGAIAADEEIGKLYIEIGLPSKEATSTTGADEITDEELLSSTEINLSVKFPVSSLISIYRIVDGEPYTDVNYTNGATFSGTKITLDKTLPASRTKVSVTYKSGGIAKVFYCTPLVDITEPVELRNPFTNYIRCRAGGEDDLVEVYVGAVLINQMKPKRTIEDDKLDWNFVFFPGPEEDIWGTFVASDSELFHEEKEEIPHKLGYKIEFDNKSTATRHENCRTYLKPINEDNNYIVCEVEGRRILVSIDEMAGDKVSGIRYVKEENTENPIEAAVVKIDWDGDGYYSEDPKDETCITKEDGSFQFVKGVSGENNIKIEHNNYEPYDGIITIPGEVGKNGTAPYYDYKPVEYYAEVRWRYVKK